MQNLLCTQTNRAYTLQWLFIFKKFLTRVDHQWNTPVRAIHLCIVVTSLLACINLGSSTALNAIISLGGVSILSSCYLPSHQRSSTPSESLIARQVRSVRRNCGAWILDACVIFRVLVISEICHATEYELGFTYVR